MVFLYCEYSENKRVMEDHVSYLCQSGDYTPTFSRNCMKTFIASYIAS